MGVGKGTAGWPTSRAAQIHQLGEQQVMATGVTFESAGWREG